VSLVYESAGKTLIPQTTNLDGGESILVCFEDSVSKQFSYCASLQRVTLLTGNEKKKLKKMACQK
jgi:hypothetical protein